MNDEERMTRVTTAAESIAESMIADARGSGDEPVVFVTGNRYFPPLRSFTAAEEIWQDDNVTCDMFGTLAEMVEAMLNEAGVALDTPEGDNCLFVVDARRFEFDEGMSRSLEMHTYSDEWRPIQPDVQ